jgi:hypothetical protein
MLRRQWKEGEENYSGVDMGRETIRNTISKEINV